MSIRANPERPRQCPQWVGSGHKKQPMELGSAGRSVYHRQWFSDGWRREQQPSGSASPFRS